MKTPCRSLLFTHAAAGSEMDFGGVISNPEGRIGRLAPPLLPKVSFLDPTNTYSRLPDRLRRRGHDLPSLRSTSTWTRTCRCWTA